MKHLTCIILFTLVIATGLAWGQGRQLSVRPPQPETQQQDVSWVASNAQPADAISSGAENGNELYVCRARYQNEFYPGKVISRRCNISYRGREIGVAQYELLAGRGSWGVPENNFAGALTVGRSYLCRVNYENANHPGKVVDDLCAITYGGQEKSLDDFEVFYPGRDNTVADANKGGNTDNTPNDLQLQICRAALEGSEQDINNLLRAGAPSDARNAEGRTALTLAAEKGRVEIVNALLRGGADVNLTDNTGRTALLVATESGSEPVARALLARRADPNLRTAEGVSVLMMASQRGLNELMRSLLRSRIERDARDNQGHSALWYAAANGQTESANLLLRSGMDAWARDNEGHSPLYAAAAAGHADTVRAFFDTSQGRAPIESEEGELALTVAANNGHVRVLEALAEGGAPLNYADSEGRTLLMKAALSSQTQVIEYLLRKEADPAARDRNGVTAIGCAAEANKPDAVRALYAASDRALNTEEMADAALRGAALGFREAITAFLDSGFEINQADASGNTLLMRAADGKHDKLAKFLVQSRADVNLQNDNDETALMLAARSGAKDVVKVLLAARANSRLKDRNGKTALDLARANRHNDTAKELAKARQ